MGRAVGGCPTTLFAPVAQLVEPAAHNGLGGGSNPSGRTNLGGWNYADCGLVLGERSLHDPQRVCFHHFRWWVVQCRRRLPQCGCGLHVVEGNVTPQEEIFVKYHEMKLGPDDAIAALVKIGFNQEDAIDWLYPCMPWSRYERLKDKNYEREGS